MGGGDRGADGRRRTAGRPWALRWIRRWRRRRPRASSTGRSGCTMARVRRRSTGSSASGTTGGPPARAATSAGRMSGPPAGRRVRPGCAHGGKGSQTGRVPGPPRHLCDRSAAAISRHHDPRRDGLAGSGRLGGVEPVLGLLRVELVPWLRAADEAADLGWPAPVRDQIPVNVTVPALRPRRRRRPGARFRLHHRQGQGRRAGAGPGRRSGAGRGRTRGARPVRPVAGGRQRGLGRRPRLSTASPTSTASTWSTSNSPAGPSRSWPTCGGGWPGPAARS